MKSEGGQAEEIIDEENGILISAMLRQYFMSLRTIGQWKHLADHWLSVAEKVQTPLAETPLSPTSFWAEGFSGGAPRRNIAKQAVSGETSDAWRDFLQRRFGLNLKAMQDGEDSSSEDEDEQDEDEQKMDFEILLMRKFFGRWAQRAGVKAGVSDALDGDDVAVDWTRVIAPVLEGRIKMVGA